MNGFLFGILIGVVAAFSVGIIVYWLVAEYEEYKYRQWLKENLDPMFHLYKSKEKK